MARIRFECIWTKVTELDIFTVYLSGLDHISGHVIITQLDNLYKPLSQILSKVTELDVFYAVKDSFKQDLTGLHHRSGYIIAQFDNYSVQATVPDTVKSYRTGCFLCCKKIL